MQQLRIAGSHGPQKAFATSGWRRWQQVAAGRRGWGMFAEMAIVQHSTNVGGWCNSTAFVRSTQQNNRLRVRDE